MITLLLICMGVIVDAGRYYVVQAKAQTASDAALLGAAASSNRTDPKVEMVNLFKANFPANYMGSVVGKITVTQPGSSTFEASFSVTIPMAVMRLFGTETATVNILSQVTKGYEVDKQRRLELALVLANTTSMNLGVKLAQLKQASHDLTDILFGDSAQLQNLHISVVPFDVAVNVGPQRAAWVQPDYLARYLSYAPSGFLANRNSDRPQNGFIDYSSDPPVTPEMQFRTPHTPEVHRCDVASPALPPMRFAMNMRAEVHDVLDSMVAAGCARNNVGLMWGWFTLSPKWQGVWDQARPDFPQTPDEWLDKALVIVSDGMDLVYNGENNDSTDSRSAMLTCEAIKAEGVTIYTIGLGGAGDPNEQVLRSCASQPNYYFRSPDAEDLRQVFHQIADDITYQTIRLSK